MTVWIAGVLTAALLAGSPVLAAEESTGPLDATLRGSSGKEVALSSWRGKPVILFYEDRRSTTLNSAFKEALFARGREQGLLEAAWVVAVANLEAYDFFPARGIALSYVRDEEKKWGIPILVDLKGTLGAAPWNLPKKTSSVLLLDDTGAVVFRYSGRMKEEDMEAFFQALGGLLGQGMPGAGP
jgi:hypothetical protein